MSALEPAYSAGSLPCLRRRLSVYSDTPVARLSSLTVIITGFVAEEGGCPFCDSGVDVEADLKSALLFDKTTAVSFNPYNLKAAAERNLEPQKQQ